jgi:hypothetical protein
VDGRASVIASSPSLLGRGCWCLGPMGSSLGERELEVSIPGLFARGCCRSHYQLHINIIFRIISYYTYHIIPNNAKLYKT